MRVGEIIGKLQHRAIKRQLQAHPPSFAVAHLSLIGTIEGFIIDNAPLVSFYVMIYPVAAPFNRSVAVRDLHLQFCRFNPPTLRMPRRLNGRECLKPALGGFCLKRNYGRNVDAEAFREKRIDMLGKLSRNHFRIFRILICASAPSFERIVYEISELGRLKLLCPIVATVAKRLFKAIRERAVQVHINT